jgi:hypothetical protein
LPKAELPKAELRKSVELPRVKVLHGNVSHCSGS